MKYANLNRPVPVGFPLAAAGMRQRLTDYLALAKPRLNLLVIATSMVGFYLGSRGPLDLLGLLQTAIGTAFVAGGAAGLNQVAERETDGLMERTRHRPLPGGRLSPGEARAVSWLAISAGLAQLTFTVNVVAALVALTSLVVYTGIYTPLKRRTPLATLVGAVPGALPPLIGWAGARGTLTLEAWTLFAIVFFWQIPHFNAIAWLYRDDYRRAGLALLPVLEPDGRRTGRQSVLFAALLGGAAVSPWLVGLSGPGYAAGACVLSLAFFVLALRFAFDRSTPRARWLFYGSLVYLPILWSLAMTGRTGP